LPSHRVLPPAAAECTIVMLLLTACFGSAAAASAAASAPSSHVRGRSLAFENQSARAAAPAELPHESFSACEASAISSWVPGHGASIYADIVPLVKTDDLDTLYLRIVQPALPENATAARAAALAVGRKVIECHLSI
jgi:hypothetical protein